MKLFFKKTLAWALTAVMILLAVPAAMAVTATSVDNEDGGIFREFVTADAPEVTDFLYVADMGTYHFARIRFQSSVENNKIYATVVYPKTAGAHPAVLVCHGGGQYAVSHEPRMHNLGAAGYIAIAPDLPGIADPKKAVSSVQAQGAAPSEGDWWTNGVYGADHMVESTDPKDNSIYDGVATALEAFQLLKSGNFIKNKEQVAIETVTVDTENMGVCGLSWGGYTATMVAGIMQEQVKALFSEYGSGHFDTASYWTDTKKLASLSQEARQCWLDHLDAGRRTEYITADCYYAAASNDTYFQPPAVMKTVNEIAGNTNQVFAPNNNHAALIPGGTTGVDGAGSPAGCRMMPHYFNTVLKADAEEAFPVVKYGTTSLKDDGFHFSATITASETYPVTSATLYYSDKSAAWTEREWKEVPATISGNIASAVIPKEALSVPNDFYMLVSDERPVITKVPAVTESVGVSASTLIYTAPTVGADEITVDITSENADSVNVGAGDGKTYRQFFAGSMAKYTVNVPAAGLYNVHMSVGTVSDVSYHMYVNGLYCGSGVIEGSGDASYPREEKTLSVQIPLQAGENVIAYQGVANNMNAYSIILKPAGENTSKVLVDALGFVAESGNISKRNAAGKDLAEGETLASFVLWGGNVTYNVYAPKDGYYSLDALVATGGGTKAATVTSNEISTTSDVTTENWNKAVTRIGTGIALKKGENTVTLTANGLWMFGDGLCFTYEKEWARPLSVDILSADTIKYGNTRTDASNQVLFANSSMVWNIDISYDGLYTLDGMLAGAANGTADLAIWIDGVQTVEKQTITFGASAYKKEAHIVTEAIPLTAGRHTIRVSNRAGTVMIYSLNLSKTAEYTPGGYAAFAPDVNDEVIGNPSAVVSPGVDNIMRSQVWFNAGYTWHANLAAGSYKVTLLGVTSEAYPGKAKLAVDGETVADNCIISNNGYATDAEAVKGTFAENQLIGSLQIAESGEHTFTLSSVNQNKFYYFRRLIVERIGDIRPDIIEVFDANGNKTEDAKAGVLTVKANFFEEHEGTAATLYIATYKGGALTKAVSANRTTESYVEKDITVIEGETVKAFLWNSVSFAPLCKQIVLRPINTDPFAGDDEINVVFLGGSITFGSGTTDFSKSYASLTGAWLKETYGADKVNCYNEGVPGTPSNYGLLRLQRDVISHNPDLVFVEFAVNDGGRDSRSDVEGIVKMLQDCPTKPYIVFLYTTNATYTTPLQGFGEIAAYYDIPSINLKDALYAELKGKNPKDEGYFADTVHPTNIGHAFYAKTITDSLATGRYYRKPAVKNGTIMAGSGGVTTTFLPLFDDSVEMSGTWIPGVVSPAWSHDKDILCVKSSMAGDKLSFQTEGSILGIEFGYHKNAMKFEVWVDGVKRMTVDPYYGIESNQLICDASSITFALSEGSHNVEIITVANERGGSSELTLYSVVYGSYTS